jgi:hypothetical protein
MFNKKAMDVASFLTTIALNNSEVMEESFPLYKVCSLINTLQSVCVWLLTLVYLPWNM